VNEPTARRVTMIRQIAATILAIAIAGCASQDKKSADAKASSEKTAEATPSTQMAAGGKPLRAEDAVLASMTATVEAINHETREVTLKGPSGNSVTFVADKNVKRLDEINVGDEVSADYYVSVARELRAPTADEKQHPVTVVEGAGRTTQGTDPGAGGLRIIKMVTTVQAIDLPNQTITLKVSNGKSTTVRAPSLENLKKVKVGDTIIVTYSEGIAVSVTKVAPEKK
jgi:hypothetical protein